YSAGYWIPFLALAFFLAKPLDLIKCSIGFAASVAPLLIRNARASGSPLFPALPHLFPSLWYGPTFLKALEVHGQAASLAAKPAILYVIVRTMPWTWLTFVPAFPFLKDPSRNSTLTRIHWAALAGLALFVLHIGNTAQPRWAGPGIALLLLT